MVVAIILSSSDMLLLLQSLLCTSQVFIHIIYSDLFQCNHGDGSIPQWPADIGVFTLRRRVLHLVCFWVFSFKNINSINIIMVYNYNNNITIIIIITFIIVILMIQLWLTLEDFHA
jgi:hypothetical protein